MGHLKQHHAFVFGVMVMYLLAGFIQSHFLLNGDVSWDILATRRLLAGGTYTHDFFDLNPPLIFFIFSPVIAFIQWFSMSTAWALRLYVGVIALMSLGLCYLLLRPLSLKKQPLPVYWLLTITAFLYLVLPCMEFGEREHLLFLFVLPYVFALHYRLEVGALRSWFAFSVGSFAFLGFALKPFFLIPWVLVELYAMMRTRRLTYWLRIEAITIVLLLLVYLLIIVSFYPDYVALVVPTVRRFYYLGFGNPVSSVMVNGLVIFCGAIAVLSCFERQHNPYRTLCFLMFWALIGFIAVYALQHTSWFYHLYPAFSMAILLSLVWCWFFVHHYRLRLYGVVTIVLIIAVMPFSLLVDLDTRGAIYSHEFAHLITFLRSRANHQPVYVISASPREIFPAVDESGVIYASRFMHLFWTPGVAKDNAWYHSFFLSTPIDRENESLLNTMVGEDIARQKPAYILVDVKVYKSFYDNVPFDYLAYLLKNKAFATAFEPYQYLETIETPHSLFENIPAQLYVVNHKDMIQPDQMNGDAIVLAGAGLMKTAYFIKHHHWLMFHGKPLTVAVEFPASVWDQLRTHEGQVVETAANASLIQYVIHQASYFPRYRYQVYQRQRGLTV